MDRLDAVIGFDNWQNNYSPGVGSSIVCNIGLRIGGEWIWKADGAGPSDMEAEKGALSDAFKRAAVRWGVGRYLYDIEAPWLELDKRGNTAFIRAADHPRLAQVHEDFARKAGWGPGDGVMAYRVLIADLKMQPTNLQKSFLTANRLLIDRLPLGMRKHLLQLIEKDEAA
jgi:hypothetical protein